MTPAVALGMGGLVQMRSSPSRLNKSSISGRNKSSGTASLTGRRYCNPTAVLAQRDKWPRCIHPFRLNGRARRAFVAEAGVYLGDMQDDARPFVAPGSRTMVWFKYDLRTDDHPGMVAAAEAAGEIVPFFCFDPQQYVQVLRAPGGPEALWAALKGLQESLREQGSDLIISVGKWEAEVPRMVAEAGATVIITEDEAEYKPRVISGQVEAALSGTGCKMERWSLSLFDPMCYEENFREFAAKMGAALPPISCPRLPPLPKDLQGQGDNADRRTISLEAIQAASRRIQESLMTHMRSIDDDEWAHEAALGVVQGESAGVQALEDYLSVAASVRSSALASASQPRLTSSPIDVAISKVESPAGPGGSFRAVFSHAMTLGTLSRRRVYQLAAQYENDAQSGQKSLLSGVLASIGAEPSTDALGRAAKECAITWDFHISLAKIDAQRGLNDSGLEPRYWRWRGMLTHYVEASPEASSPEADFGADAPAILLVHGFGAFGEHWRRNVRELADAGYRVYAPTYPGYGRSEKPMAAYSQNLWTDFLRDFVLQIVGEKVVVAGNSIGGFLSASMAADHPELVSGLVLLNSAGGITKSYAIPKESPGPRNTPFWIADTISKLLISYLEKSIASQLASLYPTNPKAADKYLADEIYRAACDPGALGVFRSVFYLPTPRPINFLIDSFAGPTLVLQGKLDPLNDAVGRAKSLEEACESPVKVILLEAGHCPHDEVPETVNKYLTDFVQELQQASFPAAE